MTNLLDDWRLFYFFPNLDIYWFQLVHGGDLLRSLAMFEYSGFFFFGVLSEQKEQFEDGKLVGVYFYTIAFHISDNANKYLVRRII